MRRSLRNRRAGLGYFMYEGLRGAFMHKFMSFASVTIIAACLLVTVTFSLVAYNIGLAVESLGSLSEIMLFVDESLDTQQARALQTKIKSISNVEDAFFLSKDELFDSFLESVGSDAYILEDLRENNPLRHGFRVVMKDIALHAETVAALEKIPGVASSNSEKAVSDRLVQIRSVVNLVCYTLVALLGAVSVFIIYNTVKLALFSRKEEIAIMKMVGATNHFIRAPFVVEGVFLGLLAATLAFFCQWGVYGYIAKELAQGSAILSMVPFEDFRGMLFMVLVSAGIVIGAVGSSMSIRRFLKV